MMMNFQILLLLEPDWGSTKYAGFVFFYIFFNF